jgi:alanine-glyoxylate transaminase/serine-glyoxylate transaminase/serine-pyruvate transaminase
LLLREEGLEAAWARHQTHHEGLKAGLEKLGLSLLVEPAHRLPQMNSVLIPNALKPLEAEIRKTLLAEHNLEIGAGLGALTGQIWRIGLMGFGASEENVRTCLNALEEVL